MPYVYTGPAVLADGDTEIPVLAQLGLDEQDTLVDSWPGPRPRQDLHWPRPGKSAPAVAPERLTPEPAG